MFRCFQQVPHRIGTIVLQPFATSISIGKSTSHIRHLSSFPSNGFITLSPSSNKCFVDLKRSISNTTPHGMVSGDYYKILGVDRKSSQRDIKKAYYNMAKKYHPDVKPNDKNASKKFQEISEAYEVLSDDNRRQQYDMFGRTSQQQQQQQQQRQSSHASQWQRQNQSTNESWQYHSQVDPEELFKTIFGDAFRNNRSQRSSNQNPFADFFNSNEYEESYDAHSPTSQISMTLSFEEACRGLTKDVTVQVVDTCPKCNGNKCAPGYAPQTCRTCNGSGMESLQQGPFFMRTTCRTCQGRGEIIPRKCSECFGKGKAVQSRKISVAIPAGVANGQTLRVAVPSSNGLQNQEIFITFKVKPSKYFRREKDDLHSDVQITIGQALLGGTVRFRGLYGQSELKIPALTKSHSKFRLTGKGIKSVYSSSYGDHYLHVEIKVPNKLSEEQKKLSLMLAATETDVNGQVNGLDEHNDEYVRQMDREKAFEEEEKQYDFSSASSNHNNLTLFQKIKKFFS
ncbi:hypothetical protein SNEBB_000703 [Seison nebaliae]|nr:hypothetical protein SNEBB_000703 [Seison nebaliae]